MSAQYEFISTPEVVCEYRQEPLQPASSTYWVQMDDGHYEKLGDHKLRHHLRSKRAKHDDVVHEAWRNHRVTKVRCIAGLKPGLYKGWDCGTDAFLNPALVPLNKPSVAADPPLEFVEKCEQLRALRSERNHEPDNFKKWPLDDKIAATEKQLAQIYQEDRGVKLVKASNHPWRLLNMSPRLGNFPGDRRGELFRGKQGFVWVSQPDPTDIDDVMMLSGPWNTAIILGFAHLHGLQVTISPKWSWRYPGQSVLIEWTRK